LSIESRKEGRIVCLLLIPAEEKGGGKGKKEPPFFPYPLFLRGGREEGWSSLHPSYRRERKGREEDRRKERRRGGESSHFSTPEERKKARRRFRIYFLTIMEGKKRASDLSFTSPIS